MKRGFSEETVRRAVASMIRRERPAYSISDRLSDEDIANAWRVAAQIAEGKVTAQFLR